MVKKIKKKARKRRPRGADARHADNVRRAEGRAFVAWALRPVKTDKEKLVEAVEQCDIDEAQKLADRLYAEENEDEQQNTND
jgi:hypothetical protein